MTRFLPTNAFQGSSHKKMRALHDELEPGAQEIVQRMHMASSRKLMRQRTSRRRVGPLLLGVFAGLFLSSAAFAWAYHQGIVRLEEGTTASDAAVGSSPQQNVASSGAQASGPSLVSPVSPPLVKQVPEVSKAVENAGQREPSRAEGVENAELARSAPATPVRRTVGVKDANSSFLTEERSTAPQDPRLAASPLETTSTPKTPWANVAGHLQTGQIGEAVIALRALERDGNQDTRESAELLRLQLQVRAGTPLDPQQLTRVNHLASAGVSQSVRNSATRLHREVLDLFSSKAKITAQE